MKHVKISRTAVLLPVLCLALWSAGCTSLTATQEDRKVVYKKAWAGTENHVLAFGMLDRPFFGVLDRFEFAQIDPRQGSALISPAFADQLFYFSPQQTGKFYSLIHLTYEQSRTIYSLRTAFIPGSGITFSTDKAGLQYLGHYVFDPGGFMRSSENWLVRKEYSAESELKALKNLKKAYSGTEWEPVILERMRELGYEK